MRLVVAGQAAVVHQPAEGPLHDPPPRDALEALLCGVTADDLDVDAEACFGTTADRRMEKGDKQGRTRVYRDQEGVKGLKRATSRSRKKGPSQMAHHDHAPPGELFFAGG
ncbi:hypothetical protein Sgleb_49230 [Streptomyces glebosus]|uniref:Uncharacterized protein n=1 Tax=Streptomyces glebosus TaxID=249580 RepID=A0A640T3M8_9ACTN|nr:hypothetical protein Sgleb_49230 [Streptomyces glebosus]GHG86533.1 hypothetical protein GCM10010513_67900 [Streptomyces glebosus]